VSAPAPPALASVPGAPRSDGSSLTLRESAEAAYDLDPALPRPLCEREVWADFSPAHARKLHPDASVEAATDAIWEALVRGRPAIFNGLKFRLAGYEYGPVRQGAEDQGGDG
jgi:hypothetical protein